MTEETWKHCYMCWVNLKVGRAPANMTRYQCPDCSLPFQAAMKGQCYVRPDVEHKWLRKGRAPHPKDRRLDCDTDQSAAE